MPCVAMPKYSPRMCDKQAGQSASWCMSSTSQLVAFFFPKRNFWVMKRRNQDEAETPRVFYDTNGPAHGEQKETENESRPATGC